MDVLTLRCIMLYFSATCTILCTCTILHACTMLCTCTILCTCWGAHVFNCFTAGSLVVFHLKGHRVHGHRAHGSTQERLTDFIPSRLPSRLNAQHLVVLHTADTWWSVVVGEQPQLSCARVYVRVLSAQPLPQHTEVYLVEALYHTDAALPVCRYTRPHIEHLHYRVRLSHLVCVYANNIYVYDDWPFL